MMPIKKMKKTSQEVITTAQNIKYARFLAGNDKTLRDRAVKSLRKWFEQQHKSKIPITETELLLLWKGLFYSFWMADKPLIQEECAERIAALVHSLDAPTSFQFFQVGMKTLSNEWFGIDQWRSDKFMMFVRRLLRQALVVLKNNNWRLKFINMFTTSLQESVLDMEKQAPLGLFLHFCDIYMPELAKVSEGQLNANILNAFLLPFAKALTKCNDPRLIKAIAENIFRYLMRQSDTAMEYEDKFKAWKRMGFPGGSINAMQRAEEEDDEGEEDDDEGEDDVFEDEEEEIDMDGIDEDDAEKEEEAALDPRAGRVDVVLPQINFSSKTIITLLYDHRFKARNTKTRTVIKKLLEEFTELSKGDYPLGIKKVDLYGNEAAVSVKRSTNQLQTFEKQLYKRKEDSKKRKSANNVHNDGDDDCDVPKTKKQKVDKTENANKCDKNKENFNIQKNKEECNKKLEKGSKNNVKQMKVNGKSKEISEKSDKIDRNQIKLDKKRTKANKMEVVSKNGKQKENAHEKLLKKKETFMNKSSKQDKLSKKKETDDIEGNAEENLNQLRKTLKASRNLTKEKLLLEQRNKKLKNRVRKLETDVEKLKLAEGGFVRNSGTWFVTDPDSDFETDIEDSPKKNAIKNGFQVSPKRISPSKTSPKAEISKHEVSKPNQIKNGSQGSPKRLSPSKMSPIAEVSKHEVSKPIVSKLSLKKLESSTPVKRQDVAPDVNLFKTNDWDTELQEGECEIFVPSKKYLAKRKSMGSTPTSDWLEKNISIIKAKNRRRSADANLLDKLNLSVTKSPKSNKKVKIDLRLNQSQEVYEHHAQIRSSPGIPFDANRMPTRSVIKPNAAPSPINPFYRGRRVNLQFGGDSK